MKAPIHGGDVQRVARQYGLKAKEILDYSSNINPLPLPQGVNEELLACLEDIRCYPDRDYVDLRLSLSSYTGLPLEWIMVGNGATELIYLTARSLQPQKVLLPVPSFAEYEEAFSGLDTQITFFPIFEIDNFVIDVDALLEELSRDYQMLILCNPNNPTGQIIKRDNLVRILNKTKELGIYVLLDETFVEFTTDLEQISMLYALKTYDNVIILRALTKFFAVPGVRLGYCAAHPTLLEKLQKLKEPWTVNTFAEKLGIYLLDKKEFIQETRRWILTERDYFYSRLTQLEGCRVYPSNANFFLLKLSQQITAQDYGVADLKKHLEKKGIMIRDCSSFRELDSSYFRIAIKERINNLKLLDELKDWLGTVLARV